MAAASCCAASCAATDGQAEPGDGVEEGTLPDPATSEGVDGTCTPTGPEVCDGIDNDCDGRVDEDFDLSTDVHNCGECGFVCEPAHGAGTCSSGECAVECEEGWVDANGNPLDGCEYPCVPSATQELPGVTCEDGLDNDCDTRMDGTDPDCSVCVDEMCNTVDDDCDGLVDEDYDLASDERNCGRCNNVCPDRPNSTPDCVAGICDIVCDAGWSNYNSDLVDGCESNCIPTPDSAEVSCDGVDNDCDGSLDEDYVSTQCGTGPCTADSVCVRGGESCTPLDPPAPTDTTCDGIDDDCDGLVDDEGDCCTNDSDCGDNVLCGHCTGLGSCAYNPGVDCGTCRRCNGSGSCAGNSTDHGDCGLCRKCSAGTCVNQTASEDLKDECPLGLCTTGNCDNSGACGILSAGSQPAGCNVCKECNGSGSCANVGAGLPRSGCNAAATTCSGADTCDGSGNCLANDYSGQQPGCNTPCHYCSGGACTYLTSGNGYGCPAGATTACSGADTCDSSGNCNANNYSSSTRCGTCVNCNGSGSCSNPMAAGAVDSGCAACKKCNGTEMNTCTGNRSNGCSCSGGNCGVCDGGGTCLSYTCSGSNICCCPGRCASGYDCSTACSGFPACN